MSHELHRCAAGILQQWVDSHLDRFRPAAGAGLPRFSQVKPLSELALILFALGPSPWTSKIAETLWLDAVAFGERIDCDRASADVLVMFPVLEAITRRPFPFHDRVDDAFAAMLRRGETARSLKTAFACDLAEWVDCRKVAEETLIVDYGAWGAVVNGSSLYAVTHAAFFATKFGTRSLSLSSPLRTRLREDLGRHAAARVASRQLDLAAELLASIVWVDLGLDDSFHQSAEALALIAVKEGSILAAPRRASEDAFEARYHSTILTLAVLACAFLKETTWPLPTSPTSSFSCSRTVPSITCSASPESPAPTP